MATINASFKIGWNGPQLMNRVATIMTAYGKAMDQQLKEEIKLVQFPWPGITYRRNGTIEGSPRDIVDTGRFLASQRRTAQRHHPPFTWGGSAGVNYAGIILRVGQTLRPIPVATGSTCTEEQAARQVLRPGVEQWATRFEDIDWASSLS
jgi:hypothetical protein